jgi:hypothetical protein
MQNLDPLDPHYVYFGGKVVATSTTRRQHNETLEAEPTEQELAIARLIRLEINDEHTGYNVYYKNKLVRAGVTSRMVARRLAARIAADPGKFERERSGKVGSGEKAIENFAVYLAEKRIAAQYRAVHSDCRILDPVSYELIATLPANSSKPQRLSFEKKMFIRERRRLLMQMVAAE